MEEFGKLCKEVLQRMRVDINFGSRSEEFIKGVIKGMGISGQVSCTRYERKDAGDYGEVEGVLNSLSSVVKNLRDEDLSKRWERMREKLQQELLKPENEREVFTPPAIVSVKVGRIGYTS